MLIAILCDDNTIMLTALKKLLEKTISHAVISVSRTGAAKNVFECNEIDLILTDIFFAQGTLREDGYGLIQFIRAYELDSNKDPCKIIAFSGDASCRTHSLNAGADMFLSKPIRKEDLEKALRALGVT